MDVSYLQLSKEQQEQNNVSNAHGHFLKIKTKHSKDLQQDEETHWVSADPIYDNMKSTITNLMQEASDL